MAAPKLALDTSAPELDEVLVERVCAGNEEAFEEIYARYFPRVYSFLDRRLRNRADTEEVVQEVFINLFNSMHTFRGEAPFAAWVFGLTRRTLASRFKKKQHRTVSLGDEDVEVLPGANPTMHREPDPHESYEYRERLKRMNRAAGRLSDEQWTLFQLHHIQNHTIQEIAHELCKSEDAVKSHLYRARKLLLAR